MAKKKHHSPKKFRTTAGFSRLDVRTRVMRVLRHQKQEPIGIRVLEIQAQIDRTERTQFLDLLESMEKSGELHRRKNSVVLASSQGLVPARIVSVNERFGFARPEPLPDKPQQEDIFLPGRYMMGAMPGDRVLLRVSQRRARSEGENLEGAVAQIVEQNNTPFTGVVVRQPDGYYLRPDRLVRFLLPIEKGQLHGSREGDKVQVQLSHRGETHFSHRVAVVQSFGDAQEAQVCCQAVLANYQTRTDFPPEVLQEAQQLEQRGIPISELSERMDLTGLDIFTIDSADSKDLDDAVSLERDDDHWYLGVHIADVSHYVRQGSPLDLEAYRRGTSIYYADQVIPMLPKELSNGICSLNPDEVRLTFSALVTLKPSGEIEGFRFVKSYIRSRVKGVYREINAILDGTADQELLDKYAQLIPQIHLMHQLARLLRARRFDRGAMNISSNESKFVIENGKIQDILPRPTGESERMIEEFMLTANEAAATLAMQQEMPFIYRVHEQPPVAKVNLLHDLLTRLGMQADKLTEQPQPKDFSELLERARGTELEPVVNAQLLRTMAKAVYSERNIGHFGLVLENYTHFTSPIRRYPDLAIHRIFTSYLAGMPQDKLKKRYGSFVPAASKNSSEMEVNAMNIERDCEACYRAEYMSSRIGQCFEGRITGVANYGFYVELDNSVEGMVSVHDLPEGEYQLEEGIELKEMRSGKVYRVGQLHPVKVASVNVSAGQVNFVLAD